MMTLNSPKLWGPPTVRRVPFVTSAILFAATVSLTPSAVHGQNEGDYLYKVTMLRAAPGHFAELVSALESSFELHEEAGDQAPFWIRHSQGDQWDFMLIYPMGDFSSYHGAERAAQRTAVWDSSRGQALATLLSELTSYSEEWFSRSVSVDEMGRRFDGMGLFHVEMFAGLPGTRRELLEQRRMENRYYEHLDRQQNLLFVREAGSNWDAMTIGFYENLQAYAAAGVRYSLAEQDEAARVAGFEEVGKIGPYLRSLLSYHHDTLGVRVR